MKIIVNTRLLIKNKLDGIAWFSLETLKRITRKHPDLKFYFLFDRPFSEEFIFSENIEPIVVGPPTRHPILWYLWFEHRLPSIIKKIKPDLFLSPDGYLPLKTNVKKLAVIHDINFYHYPKDLPWSSRLYYNHFFPKFAKDATRLTTVSEYSKKDICKSYNIEPAKIDVLYNGYNPVYRPNTDAETKTIKKKYTNGNDFFIFIGSLHPRKNVANMLYAYERFREQSLKRIEFVIIGEKFFMTDDIKKAWEENNYKKDIHFVGRMEAEEIQQLLAAAVALILVSKLEGFGIPVIEGYKCNTPAIVSNVSSLPEVAGEAALYAQPFSIDSIKNAMYRIVEEEGLRQSLSEKCAFECSKFSWEKTTDRLWESINRTLNLEIKT